jgi:hypothetical protein
MLWMALLLGLRIIPGHAGLEYRQPQMAAAGGRIALVFGAADTVYCATSRNGGVTFSDPVAVSGAGKLALGRHRGPRVAIVGPSIVVSAVIGEKGGGADGDLLVWRSLDQGKTWSAPSRVNDVAGAAREGLHAMIASPGGKLYAAWLDLRRKGTRLYGAWSGDGGQTWSPNVLIYGSPDGHICECCHPSLAAGPGGDVYAMWRNWLGGSRDLYLAASSDGGRSFGPAEKLGAGTWPLEACPMDGGGLAISAEGRPMSIWRRAAEIFLAPAGGTETSLGEGHNPSIVWARDGFYAIWSGPAGVVVRIPGRGEAQRIAFQGSYPVLVALPSGAVLGAWEEKGALVVRIVQ